MRFVHVDVFGEQPYRGNALAVFLDAVAVSGPQMQEIAREMNLSESAFVTNVESGRYDVRIFTPCAELPFAGHPTLGTAWALRELELATEDELVQRSAAGETRVHFDEGLVSFSRKGTVEADLDGRLHDVCAELGRALGLSESDIALDTGALGRSGTLGPVRAEAGVKQLLVPVRDLQALQRISVRADLLSDLDSFGAFCFTATGPGQIRARGFWPGAGISEDPATGSAAAALGLFLADRLGAIDLQIDQGVEMGRPSVLHVEAVPGQVRVAGRCHMVLEGGLQVLPSVPRR